MEDIRKRRRRRGRWGGGIFPWLIPWVFSQDGIPERRRRFPCFSSHRSGCVGSAIYSKYREWRRGGEGNGAFEVGKAKQFRLSESLPRSKGRRGGKGGKKFFLLSIRFLATASGEEEERLAPGPAWGWVGPAVEEREGSKFKLFLAALLLFLSLGLLSLLPD